MAKEAEQAKNDDDADKHEEKLGLFVKVPEEIRHIIDKYKEEKGMTISNLIASAIKMYDNYNSMDPEIHAIINKYKDEDELVISFLEKAVKFYGEQKELHRDLFIRMREEMKMMLIGKTTFNQLIAAAEAPEKAVDMPQKSNVAFDIIMWYNQKPIKSLTIEEIINSIKTIWIVANYFYAIDITHENEDQYHLLFRHRQDKRYSRYWLGYFTEFFKSKELSCKCMVEGQAFDESISLSIKVAYQK
ncbi:MAG: hypothetical protein ACFE85_06945 [Candidatus Hodarchaeota archaeon]